jgi:hypothetical protein
MEDSTDRNENLPSVLDRIRNIEAKLDLLLQQRLVKEWYSTDEVANILGKSDFTVREWCRLGRVHAQKKGSGRGKYQAWVISHAELLRFQREGLLPANRNSNR